MFFSLFPSETTLKNGSESVDESCLVISCRNSIRSNAEIFGQAESTVHMLNWGYSGSSRNGGAYVKLGSWKCKFLGVEFDQSEDEEVAVSDTTHLRAEDLDFRVECLGGGIGRTTAEVVQDGWSVVPECFDYRAEVVVTKSHYLFIPLVHPPHGFCR